MRPSPGQPRPGERQKPRAAGLGVAVCYEVVAASRGRFSLEVPAEMLGLRGNCSGRRDAREGS